MKLQQRISIAYKALTATGPGNSLGSVLRNYAKAPSFRPQEQVTGITYKAIDKIGQSISDYELIVKKPNGDPYPSHPLYALQRNPNPRQTSSDFHHLYGMFMEIYGETFWYKVRGEKTGRVKELYLLNPAQIEVKVSDGEVVGYVLHKLNGTQVPFLPEEIHHDKRPNPFNELRGMSVLEKAAVYVDTEIATSTFTLNYIKNNASPSGIVSLPNMNPDTFKQFAAQWREGYEGPENAGKTAFIRGEGASFQAVGATLQDIDQKITRDMAKEDVLMMLDMPKGMLGIDNGNGLGRAGIETLMFIYNSEKIEPMMHRLDDVYEALLTDGKVGDTGVEVTHESPVPEDKEYKLAMYKEGVNKWLTPNEIRENEGLPPLTDGTGDVLAPTNANVAPAAPAKAAVKLTLKKAPTQSEIAKSKKNEREAFRKNLVETNSVYSEKIKTVISEFASDQEAKVIRAIDATSKSFEEWLFEVKAESEKLASLILPVILQLMEAQSADVANFITGELLVISDKVRKDAELEILKISGIYNQDTITALEKTLAEGHANGESLVKLKKRVENEFSNAKGYRAERIARTESLRASNTTAELVYKQNGYSKVQWFVNPGACEFCQTYSGMTREVGSTYSSIGSVITGADGGQMRIEYSDVNVPPLHPNCTCSIVPA